MLGGPSSWSIAEAAPVLQTGGVQPRRTPMNLGKYFAWVAFIVVLSTVDGGQEAQRRADSSVHSQGAASTDAKELELAPAQFATRRDAK